MLFYEAMEMFSGQRMKESFARFERAVAKGHEESFWITSLVKDVDMKWSALMEVFAKTEKPLGWYFAGRFSYQREAFDFYKKSAEGGCSWGQVDYGWYFRHGNFLEKDEKIYVEWLEKASSQNTPEAMYWLGDWFRNTVGDKQKAVSYYRCAAELGWKLSMLYLAEMLNNGEGCEKDLRQAAIWGAKAGESYVFWHLLAVARRALGSGKMEDLDCDFNQFCYSLGWGLYWYQYEARRWEHESDESKAFGNRCLDYYCSCVELQQKSIFTFLLCWNRTTGVKGPGQIIAQMVWEGREDNLVSQLEQPPRRSARLKRIKK
jgi:hypothetical protein